MQVERMIDKRGAEVFKALAHPSRLLIVRELGNREYMCVCEITAMVESDISTVSRHLGVLRNAGIIKSEKVANEMHYSLAMPCVLGFLECIGNVKDGNDR